MKFSLVSDLHLDHPQPRVPYHLLEERVIVAGDTANGLEGLKFLQKLRYKGHTVYAVDGNHEHYRNYSQGRFHTETTARFREEHKRYHDEEVPVVLACGWYQVKDEEKWKDYMNDSHMCMLTAEEVNHLAVLEFHFLQEKLQEWKVYQRKGVVVTHMAPCEETLNPDYYGDISNEWYWNPLMLPLLEEFKEQILVWCHGHTHKAQDKIVNGTRVVCNPRGYPGENPNWKPITIEV